ncbi:MAG TPA: hypothetical protein VE031_07045 [Chthoniobacterales bacterium]|nr:hypothetical protein [Chthoniobacterales bacterium]
MNDFHRATDVMKLNRRSVRQSAKGLWKFERLQAGSRVMPTTAEDRDGHELDGFKPSGWSWDGWGMSIDLSERHLGERHLGERHLSERHLGECHLSERHHNQFLRSLFQNLTALSRQAGIWQWNRERSRAGGARRVVAGSRRGQPHDVEKTQ